MNPVMYLISDPRVKMSKGKFGAQAGHATMLALEFTDDSDWRTHVWRHAGGHYAKIVLMTDDLNAAAEYIKARGFKVGKVCDEGRTEFDADLTLTFLGVQIVDKDRLDVRNTFGAFKLYEDPSVETYHERRERLIRLTELPNLEEGERKSLTTTLRNWYAHVVRRNPRDS